MSHRVEVKAGQSFQDGTGLTVRVEEIDGFDRVHFSVSGIGEDSCVAPGEMSSLAFVSRFTRIDTVEDACARIRHFGYAASRHIRIYGEEFELLSDPFPEANRIAIRAKAIRDSSFRILRLPMTIVQSRRGQGLD
jgi:hypothetical protein